MGNNLISYFPKFSTSDSLFSKMISMGAPWNSQQGRSMDISYFTMWSGVGTPSSFTRSNSVNGTANSQLIAQTLWDIYGENWKRLWDGFNTEYNPIQNYNLDETVSRNETDDRTINKQGTLDSSVNGTDKHTTSGEYSEESKTNGDSDTTVNGSGTSKVTTDTSGSGTSNTVETSDGTTTVEYGQNIKTDSEMDDYTFAFNDTMKVPTGVTIQDGTEVHSGTDVTATKSTINTDTTTSNKQNTTADTSTSNQSTTDVTQNSTTTITGAESGTSDGTTSQTRKDDTTEDSTDNLDIKEEISRNRSGNVGQNSYQELLRQEFELWKWNFFKQVFSDVDAFLILNVYDSCQFS